jgi:prepilin signal peptidase PulO-like enzyme (type II secretory pathway)
MFLFFLIFSFLFGAVIGSFINCFIWRLHEGEGLWNRSYCPKCRKRIEWFDNIPVLSFLFLRGRCRKCGKKISWQYPLVELATAALFAFSFYFVACQFAPDGLTADNLYLLAGNQFIFSLVKYWLIIFAAAAIFVYDLRWYLIPDEVVLPAGLLLFLINIFLGFDWLVMIWCALIGGGFFAAQFFVSRGKWVGGGDIRLGILLGLALGRYDLLVLSILLTYFTGSIIGLFLVFIGKKDWSSRVPLGVFLTPALLASLFWGKTIIAWYLAMF